MTQYATQAATNSKYDRLIEAAQEGESAVTLVVHPCDESSLRGAMAAANRIRETPLRRGCFFGSNRPHLAVHGHL